jgi:hypothetical protein
VAKANGLEKLNYVILELSPVTKIDATGVAFLEEQLRDYNKRDIQLVGCDLGGLSGVGFAPHQEHGGSGEVTFVFQSPPGGVPAPRWCATRGCFLTRQSLHASASLAVPHKMFTWFLS